MIPRSIRLKGFLCYKDEQAVAFDGPSTLWMLSGLNGSGKSAIFDAMTFALFGQHRGGGQQHLELINKDAKSLSVEFDFTLDGQPYRARRTQTRDAKGGSKGTQQMLRLDGGEWVAIEDTNLKRGFDAWVEDQIGLSYETFTSSVLLLQGKAESLLSSKPEDRRKVLAQIVDLERYEALHKAADEERKRQEGKLKLLSNQLAAIPVVEPLEIAAADSRIAEAQEARERSRAETERLLGLEQQTRAWAELQGRLIQARLQWEQARQLLSDASAIEKAVERLRDLREMLPRVQFIVEQRRTIDQSEVRARELTARHQKLTEQLTLRDHALKQGRDKRQSHKTLIDADEARHREVTAALRKAAVQLEKLKEYERHEGDWGRLREELARLAADPAAAVAAGRAACERLTELAHAAPLLTRFTEGRAALRHALEAEQEGRQKLQQVQERGERCKGEAEALQPRVEEAARAVQQAAEQAAEARALSEQARAGLRELSQLDGAKVCRHCGQPLTAGHLQEEKRRRTAALKAAEERHKETDEALQSARAAERKLRQQKEQAEQALREARDEYRDASGQAKHARADSERLKAECGRAYHDLSDPFRQRISPAPAADWTATAYPTAEELDGVRAEASGLPAAQRTLRQAEKVQSEWVGLKARESDALQTLKRLQADLPRDRQTVRAEHARLETEEKSLERSLLAKRAELKEVEADLEKLGRERDRVQAEALKTEGDLKNEERVQQQAQHAVERAQKQLPEAWRASAEKAGSKDLFTWSGELADLEKAGAEERGTQLQKARPKVDVLRQYAEDLEAQQAAFPEEARQAPEKIKGQLAAARQTDKQCDDELIQSRQQKARLEERRRERDQIGEECLTAERELASQKLLAELLGRDRLQLYLVRQAERQVVEYANAVLDRLSGGQLYLRLSGVADGEGGSAKALELEAYNRATGEKPINVAFLSGSQKFRVAVSLALGIGQYASRRHRPIESVIIDEGFGCLDRQGRQVMIQELQNLRGQMRCILLVSHQEEFADAFNDGYHFELDGGATRVTRIQR